MICADEFNDWFGTHCTCFPSVDSWFDKLPDKDGTLRTWYWALRYYSKSVLEKATRAMAEDPATKLLYPGDHRPALIEHCYTIQRRAGKYVDRPTPHEPAEPLSQETRDAVARALGFADWKSGTQRTRQLRILRAIDTREPIDGDLTEIPEVADLSAEIKQLADVDDVPF